MTSNSREHEIVDAFIGFADRLVEDFDVLDITIQLTEDCARLIDIAAAGLLLADAGGMLHMLAGTSENARSLELFQLQRDEGPCLDCFHTGKPISVADLSTETERWPQFAAAAAEQGFASVHAIPISLRGEMLGALNLFGTSTGDLAEADLRLARGLAHVACIALVQHDHAATPTSLLATLQSTLVSRGLLETAKGVLAGAHALSMDDASSRLRHYAHQNQRRLTDVAREVVTVTDPRRSQLIADLGQMTVARLSPAR
jgi:transcriptional regulator with GAF, ATPase, and Fis domain